MIKASKQTKLFHYLLCQFDDIDEGKKLLNDIMKANQTQMNFNATKECTVSTAFWYHRLQKLGIFKVRYQVGLVRKDEEANGRKFQVYNHAWLVVDDDKIFETATIWVQNATGYYNKIESIEDEEVRKYAQDELSEYIYNTKKCVTNFVKHKRLLYKEPLYQALRKDLDEIAVKANFATPLMNDDREEDFTREEWIEKAIQLEVEMKLARNGRSRNVHFANCRKLIEKHYKTSQGFKGFKQPTSKVGRKQI